MMRDSGDRMHGNDDARDAECIYFHWPLQVWLRTVFPGEKQATTSYRFPPGNGSGIAYRKNCNRMIGRIHVRLAQGIALANGSASEARRRLMENLRACDCAGVALGALLAVSVASGPACAAAATPDLSGIYWATQYNARIQIVGSGELPLTAP